MSTPFHNLTPEDQQAYITKAREEAAVDIEIARVGKRAKRTTAVIKAYRGATITHNNERPAVAQAVPRSRWMSCRPPGPLEFMETLGKLATWYQQQQQQRVVVQTYWTDLLLKKVEDNIIEAGLIA